MVAEDSGLGRLVVNVVVVHLLVDILRLLPLQIDFERLVTGGVCDEGGGGRLRVRHGRHLSRLDALFAAVHTHGHYPDVVPETIMYTKIKRNTELSQEY